MTRPGFIHGSSDLCICYPQSTGKRAGKPAALRAGPLAAGILSYLGQHYQDAFTLDDIASHFFITKYHLCRSSYHAAGSFPPQATGHYSGMPAYFSMKYRPQS